MRIRVLRGQHQIGGSIIEIASSQTRLLFDLGLEIKEEQGAVPDIDGLFSGTPQYDAVFVSHYHPDHMGLSACRLPEIPLYVGQKSFEIHQFAQQFRNQDTVVDNPHFFIPQQRIQFQDLTVTPYLCDHSAYDAYMFIIEGEGKKILYTGDFRANGRKSFMALLEKLSEVDCVITEGTTLNRDDVLNLTEMELEEMAAEEIKDHHPVFILMSAMNIDRIVTMYKAAKRHRLLFLEDLYTAGITSIIGGSIPNPKTFSDVRVFMTDNREDHHAELVEYGFKRIGRQEIAQKRFAMVVRSSMQDYLEKLSREVSFHQAIMFYSLWSGYQERDQMKAFLAFMESKGVKIVPMHTSGHADPHTIDQLIHHVKPQIIFPVHTENANWFQRYQESRVILAEDSVEL